MNTIELIRAEIERRIKVLEYTKEQYERGEPDYDANGRMALDGLLSFLDTLQEESAKPTLPFAEEERIPGKDFIPAEWVDACERYGKWMIVEAAQIAELLFQLSIIGIGSWGKESESPSTDEEMEENLAELPKVEAPEKYKTPDWLYKEFDHYPDVELEKEINRLWESFSDVMDGPHNLFDIYARLSIHFYELARSKYQK